MPLPFPKGNAASWLPPLQRLLTLMGLDPSVRSTGPGRAVIMSQCMSLTRSAFEMRKNCQAKASGMTIKASMTIMTITSDQGEGESRLNVNAPVTVE